MFVVKNSPKDELTELEKRRDELATSVKEQQQQRTLRRAIRKQQLSLWVPQVVVQALGTVFGAGILYAVAIIGGLIKRTPAGVIITVAVLVIAAGLIIWLISLRREFALLDLDRQLAGHEIPRKIREKECLTDYELRLIQAGLVPLQKP